MKPPFEPGEGAPSTPRVDVQTVFPGGGETGALMRGLDWSRTALGPVETWPLTLRTLVGTVLNSPFPMLLAWGEHHVQLYNDGYRDVLEARHPQALGQPVPETWSEIWPQLQPIYDIVLGEGRPFHVENMALPLTRKGFVEETYFALSYSPVPDLQGGRAGLLLSCVETTAQVLGERRLRTLQRLTRDTSQARSVEEAGQRAVASLGGNPEDLPFVHLYLRQAEGAAPVLLASRGASAPDTVDRWPWRDVLQTHQPLEVSTGPRAMVLPVDGLAHTALGGVLVVGLSPRLRLDGPYREFLSLLSGQLSTALATARAYEEQKLRADQLAELDRDTTTFFSNLSQEFRSPLTLLLGSTEHALASPQRALRGVELEGVHRGALRLLKLVNTLVDFSHLGVGRVQARTEEPTDLAALTTGLVGAFDPLLAQAGLRLGVDCPPLPEPVWVDRALWEKIVLHLVSNAFKYTFEGRIDVRLRWRDGWGVLSVQDTGLGIPVAERARIFERFHRVEGVRGRGEEGGGNGLALVHALVRRQGGTVSVEGAPGQGSTFTVELPLRQAPAHPAPAPGESRPGAPTAGAQVFLHEASQWLPPRPAPAPGPALPSPTHDVARARLLLADDNADVRDYLEELLSGRFTVQAVEDGQAALDAARAEPPDVVLSDVMMPGLDGFALLRALKADPLTAHLPVILISARAGEDNTVQALEAGADDYLVKPFGARELLARVEVTVKTAQARAERERLLREVEATRGRLSRLIENAPAFVCTLRGPEHHYELVNPLYQQLVGAQRELRGSTVQQALPEVVAQGFIRLLDDVYRTGVPFIGREVPIQLDQGGEGHLEEAFLNFVYQPRRNGHGQVEGIDVFGFEVTEQVRARQRTEALAERLRESEERLLRVVESSGAGLWELHLVTRRIQADAHVLTLMGLGPGEVLSPDLARECVHPEDIARLSEAIAASLAGVCEGRLLEVFRTIGRGGAAPRWVEVRGQRLLDAHGRPVGLEGVMLDVTARKQAEAELERLLEAVQRARGRLSGLIENAPAFVCTLAGPEHVFELMNPLYRRLVGAGRELVGLPVSEGLPEIVAQGFIGLLDEVYRTGVPFIGREVPIQLDRSGEGSLEEAFLNFVYQPRRDGRGQVEGIDVFGFEVTDQVQARQRTEALAERLRESEERLRRVTEASGAGFWELEASTGRMQADARVMSLLGLVPGAPLYLELALACVYAEDREALAQALSAALAGEPGHPFVLGVRTVGLGDVPQRWVELRGQRRVDARGQTVTLAGAMLDITARKQAESVGESLLRALGESEERYRMATRATKDAIWDWDLKTDGVTWNEGLYELFGHGADAVAPTGTWWLEAIHPEDRQRISDDIHAVIDAPTGNDWKAEYRFRRGDGTWAFVADRGWVARDASGRALRMVGAMQDHSERKAMEVLRARQSRHHALGEQVGLALSRATSLEEMLQACARALVEQVGAALARIWLLAPREDVLELKASAGLYTHLDGAHGRVPVGRYKIGRIAQEKTPHLSNAIADDPWVGDPDWARREGLVAFAGYPLLVGDRLVGVIALFARQPLPQDTFDTLQQVADSIALGVERLRAETELRKRVDFEQKLIGIVSHDLRNPLNAILLGSTVLSQREVLDARATKSVMRIQSSAERATRMVKDLLDFTQARLGGGIPIERRPADLHEVTRGVLEEVEAAYPTRALEVRREGDGRGAWDADRIAQVVQNLVTNALKYSPEDSRVAVATQAEDGWVSLAVSNRGEPIPAAMLSSIFEPMQRATAELDRTGRSVGLGLYIVKQLVAAHGGSITVVSTPEQGTTFTVRLPRQGL